MSNRFRKLNMEQMEARQMMAANILDAGAQQAASPKADSVPAQVAPNLDVQLAKAPTVAIGQNTANPLKEFSPDQLRTLDQALGSLNAIAKLGDGFAQMDHAAAADQLKSLTDALAAAGVSQDTIDRLFGASGAVGFGAGLGQSAPEFDPIGLSDHPGWTAGQPDLASFRSAADFRSGMASIKSMSLPDANGTVTIVQDDGTVVQVRSDGTVTFERTTKLDGGGTRTDTTTVGPTEVTSTTVTTDGSGRMVEKRVTTDDTIKDEQTRSITRPGKNGTLTVNEKTSEDGTDISISFHNYKDGSKVLFQFKHYPAPDADERGPAPSAGHVYSTLTGGLTDPADEFTARDFDMSRFVRSLVGFLQSKVNPNPNGPTIDLGGGTVPFTPPGGDLPDPVDDMPKHPIMAPKPKTGPNPIPPLPPGARTTTVVSLANTSLAANGVGTSSIMVDQRSSTQSVTALKPASITGK